MNRTRNVRFRPIADIELAFALLPGLARASGVHHPARYRPQDQRERKDHQDDASPEIIHRKARLAAWLHLNPSRRSLGRKLTRIKKKGRSTALDRPSTIALVERNSPAGGQSLSCRRARHFCYVGEKP